MAVKLKNYKPGFSPNDRPRPEHIEIVDQSITVGQLTRGGGSIKGLITAIRSAESVTNPHWQLLYNIYNDITLDGHVDMLMGKRTGAVLNADAVWKEVDQESELYKQLNEPWFWKMKGLIMKTRAWGKGLLELKTGEGGRIVDVVEVPRQNVRTEYGVITRYAYGSIEDGIHYKFGDYPKYIFQVGEDTDMGYLRFQAPYVYMKRDNLSFFAIHNELFGSPFRVYTYDPMQPDSRKKVTEQAEAAGHAAYVVIPKGSEVDFKESNKSGSRDVFESLHKICNDEMTLNVLRQSLTTTSDGKGSYSLGKVHKDVEQSLNFEDMFYTEMVINYSFKPLALAHGYPLQKSMFSFNEIERLSMEQAAKVLAIVAQHAPIAYEYWWDKFGVPHPDDATIQRFESSRKPVEEPEDPEEETDPDADPKPQPKKKRLTAKLEAKLKAYYGTLSPAGGGWGVVDGITLAATPDTSALDAAIAATLQRIYSGELKPGYYSEELVRESADLIYKGVEQGFGSSLSTLAPIEPDAVMLTALKRNVYEFAVWKNYQFVGAASDLLIDQSGQIRSLADFIELVRPQLADTYYKRWIEAEYNTAIGKAQGARDWMDFAARDEDVMLEWDAVIDNGTAPLDKRLDKVRQPRSSKFWTVYWYPLHYNCRCRVKVVQSTEATDLAKLNLPQPPDGFKGNAGIDRQIFSADHPYLEQTYGPVANYSAWIDSQTRN